MDKVIVHGLRAYTITYEQFVEMVYGSRMGAEAEGECTATYKGKTFTIREWRNELNKPDYTTKLH